MCGNRETAADTAEGVGRLVLVLEFVGLVLVGIRRIQAAGWRVGSRKRVRIWRLLVGTLSESSTMVPIVLYSTYLLDRAYALVPNSTSGPLVSM